MTKLRNYLMLAVALLMLSSCLAYRESLEQRRVRKDEIKDKKMQRKNNRKLRKQKYKAEITSLDDMIEKYKDWESGGTKSIKLSLLEHNQKMNSGTYSEYKGTAEDAITQSQAKSLAQANAYAMFAKDIGSIVQAVAKKNGEIHKNNEGTEAFEKFKEKIAQNAIIAANNFLEKTFVFVRKTTSSTWDAEIMYVFNESQDLDATNEILKKTLQNTKLTVKEKLWLKKLMDDLDK